MDIFAEYTNRIVIYKFSSGILFKKTTLSSPKFVSVSSERNEIKFIIINHVSKKSTF